MTETPIWLTRRMTSSAVKRRLSLMLYGADVKKNLELLIQAGAKLNHQDSEGYTPTLFAAGMNWYDSVFLSSQGRCRLSNQR